MPRLGALAKADEHGAEAADGIGGGPGLRRQRRHHRIEKRQGHGGADSAQHRPPGDIPLRDEHHSALLATPITGLTNTLAQSAVDVEPGSDSAVFIRIWNGALCTIPETSDANA